MKKFFRDALITLLLVVLIDYLYGFFLNNEYSEKRSYIKHHSNEITTLVIGNSLAERGINTSVFGDSAWCFALGGRAMFYDSELLKLYLPTMQNLHTIIFPLHYNLHTDVLTDTVLAKDKKYFIYNYYRVFHIPNNTFPEGWLYRSAVLSDQLHWKSNKGVIFDKFGNTLIDTYYDGKMANYNPPNQMHIDKAIKYLTNMAQTCAENEVRFIVVTPPFPNTWLEGCTEEGVNNLSMITDSVNSKFPLEYRNYMYDSSFRNDSLYHNWNHLNRYGATLFARQVKEDFGI